jgi:hypothetical protein
MHENLMTMSAATLRSFATEHPIVLQQTNWAYEFALLQILLSLMSEGTLVMTSDSGDPRAVPSLIQK